MRQEEEEVFNAFIILCTALKRLNGARCTFHAPIAPGISQIYVNHISNNNWFNDSQQGNEFLLLLYSHRYV